MENSKAKRKQTLPIRRRIARDMTGICVEYSIDTITKSEYIYSACTKGVQRIVEEQIIERLWHYPDGELSFTFLSSPQDAGPQVRYGITISYRTSPDYRFISRIFDWLSNFSPFEALASDDFRRAYGPALGEHIFGKWCEFRMDLSKMIGYVGADYGKGQKLLGIIMDKVVLYEARVKRDKKEKELSDGAAPSVSRRMELPNIAGRSELQGKARNGDPRTSQGFPAASAGADGLDTSDPIADAAP